VLIYLNLFKLKYYHFASHFALLTVQVNSINIKVCIVQDLLLLIEWILDECSLSLDKHLDKIRYMQMEVDES